MCHIRHYLYNPDNQVEVVQAEHILTTTSISSVHDMTTMEASTSRLLLPGQPLPHNLTAPPLPQCGVGCYELGGKILASVVGKPRRDGAVSRADGSIELCGEKT